MKRIKEKRGKIKRKKTRSFRKSLLKEAIGMKRSETY